MVQILAGRGCPFECIFCEWPQVFTGRKYRVRSVDNVVAEMLWIKKNLPEIRDIVFEDDTFGIDKKWTVGFCNELIENDLDFTWTAQVRANLDRDLLSLMKKAGCRLLVVGFESGSDEILRKMHKGITVMQSKMFASAVKEAGILLHGDFIVGMPGESLETVNSTWKLIRDTRPDILQVSIATPFPGTKFYDVVKQNGHLISEDPASSIDSDGHQVAIVDYPSLSAKEISIITDNFLKSYYFNPKYIVLILRQLIRKNGAEELKRMLRAGLIFFGYIFGKVFHSQRKPV